MEAYISFSDDVTGSGMKNLMTTALRPACSKSKLAPKAHSRITPTLMSYKEHNKSQKQVWDLDKDTILPILNQRKRLHEVEESKDKSFENCKNKRRKLTEDDEFYHLLENADNSTHSQFDALEKRERKVSEAISEPVKCQNQGGFTEGIESPQCIRQSSAHLTTMHKLQKSENTQNPKTMKSSSCNGSDATSVFDTAAHQSILATAKSLWATFKGKLLRHEVINGRGGNEGLSFECSNKHQFIISLSRMNRLTKISTQDKTCYDSWCLKCRNFLRKAEELARDSHSTILSSSITQSFVEIKCKNQHSFHIKGQRIPKIWWNQCKLQETAQKEATCKERELTEEQRKQQEQQRLFAESHQYMKQKEANQPRLFTSHQEAALFENTTRQVCAYAKRKMEYEMSSDSFKGEMTHVEIYNVYKYIYMPFDVLVKFFLMSYFETTQTMQIDGSLLSSHYKKLALILHPDKNKHKYAKDAFQKLSQAYQMCKSYI